MGFEGKMPATNGVKILMKLTVFQERVFIYMKPPKPKAILSPKGCHVIVVWHSSCSAARVCLQLHCLRKIKCILSNCCGTEL